MATKDRLVLVRHGETTANINQLWHGHTDTELTEQGERQAQQLGEYFHNYLPTVDAIFASPLQRAHITAKKIAAMTGVTVETDERLKEFGIGEWENRPIKDLRDELGFFERMMNDPHHRAPGGETRHEVTTRIISAVEEYQEKYPGANIVIVAHGMAIAFAIAYWLHRDSTPWLNYHHHNTAVSEIDVKAGKLITFNRTDHLNQ